MQFQSKAKTLQFLHNTLSSAKTLKTYIYTYQEYKEKNIDIPQELSHSSLIVRSSSLHEDKEESSSAGVFESILHVEPQRDILYDAIGRVFSSYPTATDSDEVFVQKMLTNISCSGVATTVDLQNLSPYIVINYDNTENTDTITSGENTGKTFYYFKYGFTNIADGNLSRIISLCTELQHRFSRQELDLEFSFSNDELYLLQVRPIAVSSRQKYSTRLDINLAGVLNSVSEKIERIRTLDLSFQHNTQVVFSTMTDWNPAEMIGEKPTSLAMSLYKELITDDIWAIQRGLYGYKKIHNPLLYSFAGIPYIDARASMYTMIPNDIDETMSYKLLSFYIKKGAGMDKPKSAKSCLLNPII